MKIPPIQTPSDAVRAAIASGKIAALHIYTVDGNVIKLSKANAIQAFHLLKGGT